MSATTEICIRGKWFTVPSFDDGDKSIVLNGRLLKVATINNEQWLDNELSDPADCIQRLKEEGVNGVCPDIFTFAQKLPATTPKYDYPAEMESTAAIRLGNFNQWWESLPQSTRKNARRAAKRGVVLEIRELDDALIRDIVELNNDSPTRQGKPFHHYGKSFEQVKKDQSTYAGRSEFICAYLGKELIGFLKVVYCGQFGTLLLLITKDSHQDQRPANALLVKAVERCQERGLAYFVYGKYRYGNQPKTSLMEFKERHGFEEVFVPRFYVPLTAWGSIAMTFKLHRGRVGILPPKAIAIGRWARSEWYRLRHSTRPV